LTRRRATRPYRAPNRPALPTLLALLSAIVPRCTPSGGINPTSRRARRHSVMSPANVSNA
jgi:hypothetical protein